MKWMWTITVGLGLVLATGAVRAGVSSLKVQGTQFLVNGKAQRLWGVRMAAAANSDAYTDELIGSLDFLHRNSINALVVCYQGSTGQSLRTFASDGKSFADPAVHQRMLRIIAAADQRNMLVIVGLFFPRRMGADGQDPRLAGLDAYVQATRLVAGELKGCHNVILSIADDACRAAWISSPVRWTSDGARACLEAAAEAAPDLPRGCGGHDHALNAEIAAIDAATVILHTEAGDQPPRFAANKPSVNLALFGRDSGGRDRQGAWTRNEQRRFMAAMENYLASDRDHLVVHFQGWTEGGMDLRRNHFDIGGAGTEKDPGIAWYFQAFNDRLHPLVRPPAQAPTPGGKTIFD